MTGAPRDRDLELLLRKLYSERGLDAHHYRLAYVERRIASRLRAVQVDTYREYCRLLDHDPDEYGRLVNALTVNVTEFFRDKPVWEAFQKLVLPEVLGRKAQRNHHLVRMWSAGCAGGEEPYTIAMILNDAVTKSGFPFNVSVYGTDIDEESLAGAKAAVYPNKELSSIPAHFQGECAPAGGGRFTLSEAVRSRVRFRRLDLFADKPITGVDVVFCRNVLIYFDRAQQERIFSAFCSALNRGGYLIIGMSEKIGGKMMQRFELLSSRQKVYRRRD